MLDGVFVLALGDLQFFFLFLCHDLGRLLQARATHRVERQN